MAFREEEARYRAVQLAKTRPKLSRLLLQITSTGNYDWVEVLKVLEETDLSTSRDTLALKSRRSPDRREF